MTITGDISVGQLVAARPSFAPLLEKYGIDYCCGGKASLGQACADLGLDAQRVIAELEALEGRLLSKEADDIDWGAQPVEDLVQHLLDTHHVYLHDNLDRLDALAQKVARVHGENHPELVELATVYGGFNRELAQHMLKEEQILFPAILNGGHGGSFPFSGPIAVMEMEHDAAGRDLKRMRELTGGYATPEDACGSYDALMKGLADLERDTHLHIHKENNILFARVQGQPAEVLSV